MDVDPNKTNVTGVNLTTPLTSGTSNTLKTSDNTTIQALKNVLEELQKIRQEQGGESAEEIRKKQGKVNLTTHNGEMLDQIEEAKANYGIGDSSKPPVTTDENSQPSPSPAPAQPNPPPQSTNNPPPAKPAASPKKKNGILLGPTMNFIKGALQGLAQGFKNVPKIIGRLFKK